ncbi:MAG: metal ABC transporter permease [Thaumarchaeota archaeon]|nr:metal ABC transporter permease [Candidatus Calditenuaceae archaeon]
MDALVAIVAAVLLFNASDVQELPHVMVTTEALEELVRAVGDGVVVVESVLGESSPSTFRLKPSVVERLLQADLFLFIGYGSEARVGELASVVRRGAPTYRLSEVLGMEAVKTAFWVSPRGASRLADAVASILSQHYPYASERIELNRQRFTGELELLDSWARDLVSTVGGRSAVVTIRPSLNDLLEGLGMKVITLTEGFGSYEQRLAKLGEVVVAITDTGAPILVEAEEEGTTLREVMVNLASRTGLGVHGPVYYEWIDEGRGIVNYPDLIRWNVVQVVNALRTATGPQRTDAFLSLLTVGLLALVAVTVTTSVVGSFGLMRGWAIFGDALSHGAIAGLVAAYVIGADFYVGALAAGLLVALAVSYIERRTKLRGDVAIAITFTSMLALAIVMLSSTGGATLNIEDVLFADVLAVSDEFFVRSLVLSVTSLVAVLSVRKALMIYCVDPLYAESIGLRTSLLHYGLLALLSGTVITAFMTVGAIPAVASFIIPPATAFLLSRGPGSYLAMSAAIPALSALGGLGLAYVLDTNVGAATVLVYAVVFVVAMMSRRAS